MDNLQELRERLNNIEELLKTQKSVLNIQEVALFTGIKVSTIYKLTSAKQIPHFKKAKHLFFDKAEIEQWLKEDRIKTQGEINQEAATIVALRTVNSRKR